MQDARLPRTLFAFPRRGRGNLFFVLLRGIAGVVASHFKRAGCPERLQTKSLSLRRFVGVSVLAVLVGLGIPRIISLMPPELINLPKKQLLARARTSCGNARVPELLFRVVRLAPFSSL